MADIFAESAAAGNGHRLDWDLHFDDVANTVTVTATHSRMARDAQGNFLPQLADPQQALINMLFNGTPLALNLLTGRLSNGVAFDGTASRIIGSGPRTRTGVTVSVTADRARVITFSTTYQPPA
jgi:hypothetical protein